VIAALGWGDDHRRPPHAAFMGGSFSRISAKAIVMQVSSSTPGALAGRNDWPGATHISKDVMALP